MHFLNEYEVDLHVLVERDKQNKNGDFSPPYRKSCGLTCATFDPYRLEGLLEDWPKDIGCLASLYHVFKREVSVAMEFHGGTICHIPILHLLRCDYTGKTLGCEGFQLALRQ